MPTMCQILEINGEQKVQSQPLWNKEPTERRNRIFKSKGHKGFRQAVFPQHHFCVWSSEHTLLYAPVSAQGVPAP